MATYKQYGLDVTIVPGGPNNNNRISPDRRQARFLPQREHAAVVRRRHQQDPVIDVAAMFRRTRKVFLTHPESKVTQLEDLKPLTLFISRKGLPAISSG